MTEQIKAIYGLSNQTNLATTPGSTPRSGAAAEQSAKTATRNLERKTLHNVLLQFRNTLQTVSQQVQIL